jgi:hypothetical protein
MKLDFSNKMIITIEMEERGAKNFKKNIEKMRDDAFPKVIL